MSAAAGLGVGDSSFQFNRASSIAMGGLLLITGIAIVALGAMGAFGPIKGVGALTSLTLGSIDIFAVLVVGLIAVWRNTSHAAAITTSTCSQEQLACVKWYCPDDAAKKRLGALYRPENDVLDMGYKNYTPGSQDKLVVLITYDKRQAWHAFGEPESPVYELVARLREEMGDRLIVLLDLENVPNRKNSFQAQEPTEMVSKQEVWKMMFKEGRYISTTDSDWKAKLEAFIAK